MARFLLAVSVAVLCCASARAADTGRVEIVSVAGYEPTMPTRFVMPFERLLRHTTGVMLVDIDNVAATYRGHRLRYNMADMPQTELEHLEPGKTVSVEALETVDGYFLFAPADPALTRSFLEQVRAYPLAPAVAERRATLRRVVENGAPFLEADVESPEKVADQDRSLVATIYHLKAGDKALDAVFFLKTTGGLGRIASALASGAKADRVVVSRGNWEFRDDPGALKGRPLYDALEKVGVKFSAVGRGELRHWDEVRKYMEERPDGARFLSDNLVDGEGATAVPATAVVEAGGLKVGFVGVTRANYAKYLGRGPVAGLSLKDPLEATRDTVRALRPEVDLLVVLSNLSQGDNGRLRDFVRGIDVIIGDSEEDLPETRQTKKTRVEGPRDEFPAALLLASEFPNALCRVDAQLGARRADGTRPLTLDVDHILLDDSLADADGYPRFDATRFELALSSAPPLIPPAHKIFPDGGRYGGARMPRLTPRDFWTLVASLMADRTRSEAAIMPVTSIGANVPGDFTRDQIASWFGWDDNLVTFELSGSELQTLLQEAAGEVDRERRDLPPVPGHLRLAAGGVDEGNQIHGLDIDNDQTYKIAGTELLLANTESYPVLAYAKNVRRVGLLRDLALDDIQKRAEQRWAPSRYAELMEGRPVRQRGLWTINFRDVGLIAQQTKVVTDREDFTPVSNSNARLSAFDQQSLSYVAKIDVDYRFKTHKWTNTGEVEFTETRTIPPDTDLQPATFDRPTNRVMGLTYYTEKMGSFPVHWLGRSIGPSAGFQYDGEVQRLNHDARRRNIYSILPGLEIFDGSIVKSLQITGNIRRDYSHEPIDSQYGTHTRALVSLPIPLAHGVDASLEGETWFNYYFRRPGDTPGDLQLEGDANFKLNVPVWKQISLSPFVDFYWAKMKMPRPLTAYSAMTGISLSFTRLWKPQYEKF